MYRHVIAPHGMYRVFGVSVYEKVLTNDDVHFLRMANNRGWATVRDIEGGSKPDLFTEVSVEVVRDT